MLIEIRRTDPSAVGTFPGTYEVRIRTEGGPTASYIRSISWPLLRSRLSRVLAFEQTRLAEIGALLEQFGTTTMDDVEQPSGRQLKLMGFLSFSELADVVAAKIRGSDMFVDLRNQGFISAHVVECPQCSSSYRIFYRYPRGGPSVDEQGKRAEVFAARIGASHPKHSEEIMEAESVVPKEEQD